MSAKALDLVLDYFDQKRFKAPRVLALVLANEADDRGGGIYESVATLSEKTEQTRRAVQLQLKAMQATGFLECVQKSKGGAGNYNEYRLNLSILLEEKTANVVQGKQRTSFAVDDLETANVVHRSDDNSIRSTTKEVVHDAVGFTVDQAVEDHRLAQWMFNRLQALNPKLRTPGWHAWCRDIRLMRERDHRTHREIAELFKWANEDPFWQSNIECPATLRKQWNKLTLKRTANGSGQAPSATDGLCARCKAPGTIRIGNGPLHCSPCHDIVEQEAHA